MAFVTGGKHFGQYTFEHWYDHEYDKGDIVNCAVYRDKKTCEGCEEYPCEKTGKHTIDKDGNNETEIKKENKNDLPS